MHTVKDHFIFKNFETQARRYPCSDPSIALAGGWNPNSSGPLDSGPMDGWLRRGIPQ